MEHSNSDQDAFCYTDSKAPDPDKDTDAYYDVHPYSDPNADPRAVVLRVQCCVASTIG